MKRPHEPHRSALKTVKESKFEKDFNGVIVSADELYHLHSDALRLICTPDAMVSSLFPGAYKAFFHGRGLEFDEVRNYQWGDDYRMIDWRVTARTGQMHTKLFYEERERTLYLLVDGSDSMHFGTRNQFKWVLAARIAAIFGWLAYESSDRVAALVTGDSQQCRFQPPGFGESSLVKVFHLLAEKTHQLNYQNNQPGSNSRLLDSFKYLRRVAKKNSLILILSDFRDMDKEAQQQLSYLSHYHEVAAIKLFDPLEMKLPDSGHFPITDGHQKMLLDTGRHEVSETYQQRFNDHHQMLIKLFRKHGIRLHSMGTQEELLDSLRNITRFQYAHQGDK